MNNVPETFTELVGQIALSVDGWEAEEGHGSDSVYLVGDDGVKVHLRYEGKRWGEFDSNNGRVRVTGCYPRHNNYYYAPSTLPEISAAVNRGPEAIARDITRRFLSEYLERHAVCVEQIAKTVASEQAKAETLTKFAEAIGGEVYGDFSSGRNPTVSASGRGDWAWGCKAEVYGENILKVELSRIPAELANQIGELIKQWENLQ